MNIGRRLQFLAVLAVALVATVAGAGARASHTPAPTSVNLAGDLESEATGGACGDWAPDCPASDFAAQPNGVYVFDSQTIPAGSWQYKVALNRGWAENYGSNFQQDGPNVQLDLTSARTVRFYYDHKTHYIADNIRSTIYTVPGNYASAVGCGDWAPECLGSFMSDTDGDGVFTLVTDQINPGNYEFKIATNESWSNPNYGAGGGSDNVRFSVRSPGSIVTFRFDSATHVPSVSVAAREPDSNVEWDGLRHDSRDTLYRTPGGAVPAGTPVTLRFRTFHDDVTGVKIRLYDVNASAQRIIPMQRVASDVSCYQASLGTRTCDFWQATVQNPAPNDLWYRFLVTDASKTVYYADDTAALDGGLGAPSDNPIDQSYALTVYDPSFATPAWARNAVVYQIFPDRFRNGNKKNDPKTGDPRYDDPALKLPWGTKPEGYCRSYADAAAACPWRFDRNPPSWSPTVEGPRGRDYMGGDLQGIVERLDYLRSLGVTALYLNPIFASKSNHGYDTADYRTINPYFGDLQDFRRLVNAARDHGIRVILDGVFNHMSSDSPFFDRYRHYGTTGACESLASPWRSWFTFTTSNVPCGSSDYEGWFGFDSIPVLTKSNPAVQDYFVRASDSITRLWLGRGAAGWRLDVMGDSSFPGAYWNDFRQAVKSTDPNALIVGELWPKDTTTLRFLRGDRADSTMNYRLRDAVVGLLAPQAFDGKGLGDSGRQLSVSQAAARLQSIWEDYPPQAGAVLMNLLDSHDTARLLWQLTPGAPTTADKEGNAANLASGKQRLRLASLLQFSLPGMPTVYYGDEVGLTGADDPDDRRTYPWADAGGRPDDSLLASYQQLGKLRHDVPALVGGDLKVLLADDASGVLAVGRKTGSQAAITVVNRSDTARTVDIPVGGYVPGGTAFTWRYGGAGGVTVSGGTLHVTLGALAGGLLATGSVDLQAPAAPSLRVTAEGSGRVTIGWDAVGGAAAYNVYSSPVTGGGWVKVNSAPVTGTSFTDSGLRNGSSVYYVVRSLDAPGNESGDSNEVQALPHLAIGWANLQWPPFTTYQVSASQRTESIYGQAWIDGVTNQPGPTASLRAQVGFGPDGSDPAVNAGWTWVDATFNGDRGSNDEFVGTLQPDTPGTYDYAYRYSTTSGRDWVYADLDGIGNGYSPAQAGSLTVTRGGDTTAPAAPTGLRVTASSPSAISLAWDAVTGDPTLYGYEVLRGDAAGGPYTTLATVTTTDYTDASVVEGTSYYYAVRAIDDAANRSPNSAEVAATANPRVVSVVFTVTVPAATDVTGRSVYIAGELDKLDPSLPQWDPGGVALTRIDPTHWTITLHGFEGTQVQYKYTLGDWDHVEKDGSCGEVNNRQVTLAYGATGTQNVDDTVLDWRNVSPCGN